MFFDDDDDNNNNNNNVSHTKIPTEVSRIVNIGCQLGGGQKCRPNDIMLAIHSGSRK